MIKTCCANTKSVMQFGRLLIKQYNTYNMQGKRSLHLRLFGIFERMPVCVCVCVCVCVLCTYLSVYVCVCVLVVTLGVQVRKLGVCTTYLAVLA